MTEEKQQIRPKWRFLHGIWQ